MAKSMDSRGKTYFMIPKNKSKTYQDLYFHFKVEKAGLHNEEHYIYVGVKGGQKRGRIILIICMPVDDYDFIFLLYKAFGRLCLTMNLFKLKTSKKDNVVLKQQMLKKSN